MIDPITKILHQGDAAVEKKIKTEYKTNLISINSHSNFTESIVENIISTSDSEIAAGNTILNNLNQKEAVEYLTNKCKSIGADITTKIATLEVVDPKLLSEYNKYNIISAYVSLRGNI